MAVAVASDKELEPSKKLLHPVWLNGENVPCVALPVRVIRKLLLDVSKNELLFDDCEFCRVSRDVPDTAGKAAAGGVNAAV